MESRLRGRLYIIMASDDGKIIYTGHPSKDFSSVAFDVLSMKTKNRFNKKFSSSPGQLLWVSSNEVVFSVDERDSKRVT